MSALPFSAVAGQDEAKQALLLAALDGRIGGVLLRGEKGTAKTTLARGLAALMPGGAPFVELPLGATEDRVAGTLDLAAALAGGEVRFRPGLLHAAHRGVLYVDEVNLLPDHLVDLLLDVAASGVNRVEREGVSHSHPSQFVLIGSMNPEEGDLRPQLLDRFGLAVDVRTPADPSERSSALARRLEFDAPDPPSAARFRAADADLAARLARARPARMPEPLVGAVARLCAAAGAEGMRADLAICRAAAALAGWEGRTEAGPADVRRVAALALAHRARRDPLDRAGMSPDELESAMEEAGLGAPETGPERTAEPDRPAGPTRLPTPARPGPDPLPAGRRDRAPGPRGRLIGERTPAEGVAPGPLAAAATVRAAAARRAAAPGSPAVERADLREAVREQKASSLVVIAVDSSASMGAPARMEAAKGMVLGLLRDAYSRRDQVALVGFGGETAEVLLRPTASVEVARARMVDLPTGGRTPLAAGLRAALDLATARSGRRPVLVLITDGRATAGPAGADPLAAAEAAAAAVARAGVAALVVDAETGPGPRLGLAGRLATLMGAPLLALDQLSQEVLEGAVRAVAGY